MSARRDPFAAVSASVAAEGQPGEVKAKRSAPPKGDWVAPVPPDAPPHPSRHGSKGQPSRVWAYRDGAGRLLHFVARFDRNGEKEVLPLTLWRSGGRMEWRWQAPPAPRPLYGIDRLAALPAAPVLVVEGEKAADAAAQLFPAYAAASWQGGGKATGKADWAALRGRRVVIWPDNDEPGLSAAAAVQKAALAAGAEGIAMVALPDGLPPGWDIADAVPAGVAFSTFAEALANALERASEGTVLVPFGYRLTPDGLFHAQPGKDGQPGSEWRLSDGFEVLGEAREPGGGGWAVLMRFQDRDGRVKQEVISRAMLAAEAGTVRAMLAGQGLFIRPGRAAGERFAAFLAEVRHSRRITLADRVGWLDSARFVLPSRTISAADAEAVHFQGVPAALCFGQCGRLDRWQVEVAGRAIGNRLLMFALSVGLSGPLLRLGRADGGGFHIRGASSTGKSTLAVAAGSVWGGGGPLGFATTWKATANALEGVAAGHSDSLLVLDELGLCDPSETGTVAYMLANGQGKARARQDGALRKRAEWRVSVLSTGEIGLGDHMRNGKPGTGRTMAGQELRLLDLSADMGAGMGAFEALHAAASPAALADAIKAACARDYGHAGPAFVQWLIDRGDGAAKEIGALVATFMAEARRDGDSGQIHRGAQRFALAAAAGELAIRAGIVPWAPGAAGAAVLAIFNRWADGFGRKGLHEERQIIEVVQGAIQQHRARFEADGAICAAGRPLAAGAGLSDAEWDGIGWDDDSDAADWPAASSPAEWSDSKSGPREGEARSTAAVLGTRKRVNGDDLYCFNPLGWKEVLRGFDHSGAAKLLAEKGLLLHDKGRWTYKVSIRGKKESRYAVRAAILEWDGG